MQHDTDSSRAPRDAGRHDDERLRRDDASTTPPAHTRQTELEESEKRKHDKSENELPSSQEKNPVPPGGKNEAV